MPVIRLPLQNILLKSFRNPKPHLINQLPSHIYINSEIKQASHIKNDSFFRNRLKTILPVQVWTKSKKHILKGAVTNILGGLILIGIGVKILLEHLFV